MIAARQRSLAWRASSILRGSRSRRVRYSTNPSTNPDAVPTPIQSQNKNNVLSPQISPEADAQRAQTSVQSQNPSMIMSRSPTPQRVRSSNARFWLTFLAGLVAIPPVSYFYYNYRKQHMDEKVERLVKEAQEKRKATG